MRELTHDAADGLLKSVDAMRLYISGIAMGQMGEDTLGDACRQVIQLESTAAVIGTGETLPPMRSTPVADCHIAGNGKRNNPRRTASQPATTHPNQSADPAASEQRSAASAVQAAAG